MRLDLLSVVLLFEIKVSSLVWGKIIDICMCFVFLKFMFEVNNFYFKVLIYGFILFLGVKSLCCGFGYVMFVLVDDV